MVAGKGKFVIRGGKVVDQLGVRQADLLVDQGQIVFSGTNVDASSDFEQIDASGCVVAPGFVDLHCHLREPGQAGSETIISGSEAGVLGGYTALLAMPNTNPPVDSVEIVQYLSSKSKDAALDVYFSAAITKGRSGESLTEMSKLHQAGVRIFTDDGNGVQDPQLMRRALEYSKGLGVTLAQHCEDLKLSNGGSINEGSVSSLLGIRAIPNAAEDVMVARDIELVRMTGAKLHFLHVSTSRSAQMVAQAKMDGLAITAEVTPHHLNFTDARLMDFNPIFKVNPPLRSENDRRGLWKAYFEEVFDAVATDHAPHPKSSKEATLDQASFGMIGLQAAFGAVNSELYRQLCQAGSENSTETVLTDQQLLQLIGMFTWKPAKIAQIDSRHGGPLVKGRPANITIVNMEHKWQLGEGDIRSLSVNSPYFDHQLMGKVAFTFVNGNLAVKEGELCR